MHPLSQTREIKNFLFSQYFADGLRITFGVLLPPLLLSHTGHLETGIVVSLGAITTSIPDNPGPLIHKRNAMLFSILFMLLTATLTGLINQHPTLIVAEIFVLCFFFSMFNIYGNRASSIGTGVLIIMILSIDREFTFRTLLEYTGCLLIGGIWYMVLSLAVSQLQPYRLAQHTLGECFRKVADYIKLKANFYDMAADLEDNYARLVEQQIAVHQQQDLVREILFKNRMMTKDPSNTARLLTLVFSDLVDLFEQSMATHYDYRAIRETFGETRAIARLREVIVEIGQELDNLGFDINANERPRPLYDFKPKLELLKTEIDLVENQLVLKKILVNLRNITSRIQNIYSYFRQNPADGVKLNTEKDLGRFVSHQNFDPKQFLENISSNSSLFRHSLRVAIVAVIGYLVSKLITGAHSYWILMTILVILKPAYSLTKQRNYERLIGTIVGGLAGALVILYVPDETARFVFLLIFMIFAYSFQRLNYVVSVLFMTPFILIMLSFLGFGGIDIVKERVIDTFIGSFIALISSYFIFPSWEYHHLKAHMRAQMIANYGYLSRISDGLTGKELMITEYKLTRKELYVSTANLGSALQRMLSEPKSKQKHVREVTKFAVLSHTLSSYIATLSATIRRGENKQVNQTHVKLLRRALYQQCEAITLLKEGDEDFKEYTIEVPQGSLSISEESPDAKLITEQLEFIVKVSSDLLKLVQRMRL
jgi:uncharacterized membrane protein (TIGR01666 family)